MPAFQGAPLWLSKTPIETRFLLDGHDAKTALAIAAAWS